VTVPDAIPGKAQAWWLSPHLYAVAAIIVVAASAYLKLSMLRLWRGTAGINDLVIFDQAIRNYSEFRGPISPARGMTPTPPKEMVPTTDFSLFADHMSPINAVLAPLYWINDSPANLLAAQAVLIAMAAWPLWVFTRRALGTTAAYLVAITYVTSGPVAQVVGFDFHEVAFAPLLTAIMYERFQAGRKVHVILAAVGIMLIKEDMGLFLAGFGIALLCYRGWRIFGAAVMVSGAAWTMIATHVLLPLAGGDPNLYWSYPDLGPDMRSAVTYVLRHPIETMKLFGRPAVKIETLTGLLLPLLFVPVLSPLLIPAALLFAERMLGAVPNWWTDDWHYNGFLIIPLICGGVDTLGRVKKFLAKRNFERASRLVPIAWATAAAALTISTIPQNPLNLLREPWFQGKDPRFQAAEAAFPHLPPKVLVEVPNSVGPALTDRNMVILNRGKGPHAPWVLVDTTQTGWPYKDAAQAKALIPELTATGYKTVFKGDNIVLLHHAGQPGTKE